MSFVRFAGRNARRSLRRVPVEAVLWMGGLVLMVSFDPTTDAEASWCLFSWMGVDACLGCGLGHSVAHLARGHLAASFAAHPLGIPVVLVLLAHAGRLTHDAVVRSGGAVRNRAANRP